MSPLRMRQNKNGFTLIELMVVVAIIAFVSAAVVPSMSLTLLRNREREAANLVIQAVFAARSRAARTGRCQQVQVFMGEAAVKGGRGGAVAVLSSQQGFRCSQAQALADFQVLWAKSISGGNFLGFDRVGLIGDDVGITGIRLGTVTIGTNNTEDRSLFFEPSGGMMNGLDLQVIFSAYDQGKVRVGNPRCVHVTSGGAVKYGLQNGNQCG